MDLLVRCMIPERVDADFKQDRTTHRLAHFGLHVRALAFHCKPKLTRSQLHSTQSVRLCVVTSSTVSNSAEPSQTDLSCSAKTQMTPAMRPSQFTPACGRPASASPVINGKACSRPACQRATSIESNEAWSITFRGPARSRTLLGRRGRMASLTREVLCLDRRLQRRRYDRPGTHEIRAIDPTSRIPSVPRI